LLVKSKTLKRVKILDEPNEIATTIIKIAKIMEVVIAM
jgi:hypothetical protein